MVKRWRLWSIWMLWYEIYGILSKDILSQLWNNWPQWLLCFYVDETVEYSGAKKALEYAKRKKKEIINVLQTVWDIQYLCYNKKYIVK